MDFLCWWGQIIVPCVEVAFGLVVKGSGLFVVQHVSEYGQ